MAKESGYSRRNQGTSSPNSQLKLWLARNLGVNKLGIQCQHCKGKAVVNKRMWLNPQNIEKRIIGRSCTYCFKTSRVPDAFR